MAYYVLIIDLGDAADYMQYEALTRLMRNFGFIRRSSKTLRPAQFFIISALPLRGLKETAESRIRAELHANVLVDAYEIKQFGATRSPARRRFH